MDRYAQQAAALAEELVASLHEHEIQSLREALSGATLGGWLAWRDKAVAAGEIRSFVRSTPSARRKAARWRKNFPALTHAAYLHCVQAHAMLHAVSQHDLTPGGAYRDTAARAGDAYQTAMEAACDFPEWPWEGESPIPCE